MLLTAVVPAWTLRSPRSSWTVRLAARTQPFGAGSVTFAVNRKTESWGQERPGGGVWGLLLKSGCHLAFLLLSLLQNNQHKLTLSMTPDDKYSEKQMQMEAEKLKLKVSSLSPEDKQRLHEKGQAW